MITSESTLRVRYGETDRMGYAYYGYYPFYYEVGRTDLLRSFGVTYKQLEEQGILLPVTTLQVKYMIPAQYDDILTIKTFVKELPSVRIHFSYEIFNSENVLINKGETTLVFMESKTRKPIKCPEFLLQKFAPYFQ